MNIMITNFPIIPFIFFLIAVIQGVRKGRRVGMKFFCAGIFLLTLISLWHIRGLYNVIGRTGMGDQELVAQHLGALLYTVMIGSLLSNISYVAISLSKFGKGYRLIDILMVLIMTSTFLGSVAVIKICANLGGSQ